MSADMMTRKQEAAKKPAQSTAPQSAAPTGAKKPDTEAKQPSLAQSSSQAPAQPAKITPNIGAASVNIASSSSATSAPLDKEAPSPTGSQTVKILSKQPTVASVPEHSKPASDAKDKHHDDEDGGIPHGLETGSMEPETGADPDVVALYAKFDAPPFNLAVRHRKLLKQGMLMRQARFKNVPRQCFLFNDIFIFAALKKKKVDKVEHEKLEMKQVIKLDAVIFDNRAMKMRGKHGVVIVTPDRTYAVMAKDDREKDEWLYAIEQACLSWKKSLGENGGDATIDGNVSVHQIHLGTLHSACLIGEADAVQAFIDDAAIDKNLQDEEGCTPLHLACSSGNLLITEMLLEANVITNLPNNAGQTPLHLAALKGHTEVVRALLKKSADIHGTDLNRHTPLLAIIYSEYRPHKADDSSSSASSSPAPSADPSTPERRGSTLALKDDIKEKEQEHQDDDDDDENDPETMEWERGECLKALIKAGAEPDTKLKASSTSSNQLTMLMVVCIADRAALARALIESGASLSAIDSDGRTALHHASRAGALHACRALVQRGAALNVSDHQKNTALHLTKSLSVAQLLLSHGARRELRNTYNKRAFEDVTAADRAMEGRLAAAELEWSQRAEVLPDTLVAGSHMDRSGWVSDETSDACLLCAVPFTLTRRKHHCRRCGMLVCGPCSAKTYAKASEGAVRGCDCCFNNIFYGPVESELNKKPAERNLLAVSRSHRHLPHAKTVGVLGHVPSSRSTPASRETSPNHGTTKTVTGTGTGAGGAAAEYKAMAAGGDARSVLLNDAAHKPAGNEKVASADKAGLASRNTAEVGATMAQNKKLALERGQKLEEMQEKSENLANDAKNFADLATKLRQKQEKSWI